MFHIFGAAIVNGKEMIDDELKELIGKPLDNWSYGGDQFEDESDFLVVRKDCEKYKRFAGPNGLTEMLNYLGKDA